MRALTSRVKVFLADEGGPTSVEYAILLGLIIVVATVGITLLGKKANVIFANTANGIPLSAVAT